MEENQINEVPEIDDSSKKDIPAPALPAYVKIENYSSDKKSGSSKFIWYVILIVGVIAGMYFLVKYLAAPDDQVVEGLNKVNSSVQAIQQKVDSISSDNAFLLERTMVIEARQLEYGAKLDENTRQLRVNTGKLQELKKLYNERIRSVDTFGRSSIYKFFSDKYGN